MDDHKVLEWVYFNRYPYFWNSELYYAFHLSSALGKRVECKWWTIVTDNTYFPTAMLYAWPPSAFFGTTFLLWMVYKVFCSFWVAHKERLLICIGCVLKNWSMFAIESHRGSWWGRSIDYTCVLHLPSNCRTIFWFGIEVKVVQNFFSHRHSL